MARHTSASSTETNAEGLNAQDRWWADGRGRCEKRRYLTPDRAGQDDASDGCRRESSNAIDDDDRADRERDTDAQRDDHDIRLSVAAGLERLIPAIEQLRDGSAEAEDEDGRNCQSS